jgi:branched-chain amino acid aminotransferase
MAKSFSLEMCPWVYRAQYHEDGSWSEEFLEQPHRTPAEEQRLPAEEREKLLLARNHLADLPLVNYTTQYGMGCFEGLKAFPQPDGTLKLFRPDENARRFESSMKGLLMPGFPPGTFVAAVCRVAGRNRALGFTPAYDPAWAKDDFAAGRSLYIRPFTFAEPGIGVGISRQPWVIIITSPVGVYFEAAAPRAVTSRRVRANPGGTGWIKADSNYVTSALAKREAEQAGYTEAIFLDAKERRFFEEGSSSNIFFVLRGPTLVTPSLEDTILPGITRATLIQLAREHGLRTEERRVSVEEAFADGIECFVSGTAAGVTYFESLTHEGRTKVFGDGRMGEVSRYLLKTLKGIQYGAIGDRHGWMTPATE